MHASTKRTRYASLRRLSRVESEITSAIREAGRKPADFTASVIVADRGAAAEPLAVCVLHRRSEQTVTYVLNRHRWLVAFVRDLRHGTFG